MGLMILNFTITSNHIHLIDYDGKVNIIPKSIQLNRPKLAALLGIKDNDQLLEDHRNWIEEVFKNGSNQRDAKWTESIAVSDKEFVDGNKS